MFAAYRNAAASYAQVRVETGVAGARPIDLVVMVYEGAIGRSARPRRRSARRHQPPRTPASPAPSASSTKGCVPRSIRVGGGEITIQPLRLHGAPPAPSQRARNDADDGR